MKKCKVGILGATGIIGQHFVRILQNHPNFETVAVTGSVSSSGKSYRGATDWIVGDSIPEDVTDLTVLDTDSKSLLQKDLDVVFSALPSNVAYDIEDELAKSGVPVFSNASAHRLKNSVPILIPEINPEHLKLVNYQEYDEGFIVTNSNCSTSGLVFGLKPLIEYGIRNVFVTTYQAISGAGRHGVSSMDILGNVIPYISEEEVKIERETTKILGQVEDERITPASFSVNATCARVPVMNGHLESVVVQFDGEINTEQAIECFKDFAEPQVKGLPMAPEIPIEVFETNDRPQPIKDLLTERDPHGMAVKVGGFRKKGKSLNFWLLVHNLMRGAAGASVLNAEFARAKGVIS